MEPSKATTFPVVERWAAIMAKRMAIDSILGLQEITQYVNESFQKHTLSKCICGFILIQEIKKTTENHLCRHQLQPEHVTVKLLLNT